MGHRGQGTKWPSGMPQTIFFSAFFVQKYTYFFPTHYFYNFENGEMKKTIPMNSIETC